MIKRIFYFTTILTFGLYGLKLLVTQDYNFYINPRDGYLALLWIATISAIAFGGLGFIRSVREYVNFVLKNKVEPNLDPKFVLVIILIPLSMLVNFLAIILAVIILIPFKTTEFDKMIKKDFWLNTGIIILLFSAIFLPPTKLTSVTFAQRFDASNFLNGIGQNVGNIDSSSFSVDTTKYSIADWSKLQYVNPAKENYIDKKVDVVGFVYSSEDFDNNTFLIGRFIVTCCAVDARPIGLIVEKENWQVEFDQDDWLRVQGKFAYKNINGTEQLVIIPDSLTKVEAPDKPYITF